MNKFTKFCSVITLLTTTFNYTSYGAIQLSNLSLEDNNGQLLQANTWAQAFTTGTEGANIKTATIYVGGLTFAGTATVSIFEDGTSVPLNNGLINSFTDVTPGTISSTGYYSWTLNAGIDLEANTQYWLAVEGDGGNSLRWGFRNIVEAAVSSAQPGWDIIEDRSYSSNSGVNWNHYTNSSGQPINNGQFVFALDGEATAVPEPLHTGALTGIAMFCITYCKRRGNVKIRV